MIPDLDIFRSAQALIKQHGADAPIVAAMRADATLEAGGSCARRLPRRGKGEASGLSFRA